MQLCSTVMPSSGSKFRVRPTNYAYSPIRPFKQGSVHSQSRWKKYGFVEGNTFLYLRPIKISVRPRTIRGNLRRLFHKSPTPLSLHITLISCASFVSEYLGRLAVIFSKQSPLKVASRPSNKESCTL